MFYFFRFSSGSGAANFIFKGSISVQLRFGFKETIFDSCLVQFL